jgi:hypothetical protein
MTEGSECNAGKRFLIKKFDVDCSLQFNITEIFPRVSVKYKDKVLCNFHVSQTYKVEFKVF